jgi:tetratricopeptide (TPR) repeat protein
MGAVYAAHDQLLDREVAIKVLYPDPLPAATRSRLLREARAAARLNHPHIVTVHDVAESDGIPFIVMELVAGTSLRALPCPVAPEAAVELGLQLLQALDHAHAQGIVHRDLKPENILILPAAGGRHAKLTDLGVARLSGGVTRSGAIVGTPLYLAPEQAVGDPVDGRADLYSLGALLYELVAGRPPFVGEHALAVVSQHVHAPLPPVRSLAPEVAPELARVIEKLLAKRPADRFPDAETAARALATAGGAASSSTPRDGAALPSSAVDTTVQLLERLARGRLVGREREMRDLHELWGRARKGESRLALLSGEPGVGKTRLANEVLIHAQLSGALVLRGGSYELEAMTPYLPFVEALRAWVETKRAEDLAAELGDLAPELARLAPEIAAKLGPQPPSPALEPNEERLRLFDHVARFLKARAAEGGVLLFLDDLHWADQGTLGLLHYLLRTLRETPILFLGAYRDVELDRKHPLAAALVEWNRERLATRIALGRLSAADTGALLATFFSLEKVSDEFAAAMFQETEGNPFFIEEVVKSLIEQGKIYQDEPGKWQRGQVADLELPQSVKEAVGRRLNRLRPATVEVLQAAAALGKIWSFPELAATCEVGADDPAADRLLDAVDEATAAQLLRPDRGEAFAFTHDKIREVLYQELNPVRRRRLHGRILRTLTQHYARDLDAHVQDLAHHAIQAGALEQGYEFSLRAAEKAERVFALGEALTYYTHARECAVALESDERVATACERLGDVHLKSGRAPEAAEWLELALAVTTDPKRRGVLMASLGEAMATASDERGVKVLESALELLDPETQADKMAVAHAMLARFHHYRMRHRSSVAELTEARRLAEPLDDPRTLVPIYAFLAGAFQHMGEMTESMAWAQRTIDLGERKQYLPAIAMGHEFMAEDLSFVGRWREALTHSEENRRLGERMGAKDRVAWSYFADVLSYAVSGRLEPGVESARAGHEIAVEIGETRLVIQLLAQGSVLHSERGDKAIGREMADRAIALSETIRQGYLRLISHRALAIWHVRFGDPGEAVELIDRHLAPMLATDHRISIAHSQPDLALALLAAGRPAEASERAAAAADMAQACGSPAHTARARRVEGEARTALGDWEGAQTAIAAAVAAAESVDSWVTLGRSLVARALLARARTDTASDRETISNDLTRAVALFDQAGARPDQERAAALLAGGEENVARNR